MIMKSSFTVLSGRRCLSFWSRRPLAFTVAAILMAMSTAVLGLSGLAAFRALRSRETLALQQRVALNAQTLTEALVLPLWNIDDAQVGRIMENALADPVTVGLRVRSGHQEQNLFRPGLAAESGSLVETRVIRKGDTVLGTLELYSTRRFLEEDLARLRTTLVAAVLGFDLLLVLGLYLLLWALVVKPIRRVERIAEQVSSGGRPAPLAGRRFLELENLHRSIAGMVALLDERFASVTQSEQRFRALFNGTGDSIFVREFRPEEPLTPFIEVNDAACRVLGYSREELLRMNPYDINVQARWPALTALGRDLAGRDRLMFDGLHKARDGREFQVEVSVQRFDLSGRTFALSVARDLSERHQLEEQLRHSQKMESMGMMAGGIAHDFNNILQVIIGFAGVLEAGLPEADPNRRPLDQIQAATQRASQLTRSLLAFSRKESIEPRPGELNGLVRQLDAFLKRVIGEDIDLVTRTHPEPLEVLIDEGQIEQVLVNLAANARDAMPKGGSLRIETGLVIMDEDFIRFHGFGQPGAWASISISDNGRGMDEATRLRVFDPFFTTKSAGKGTGLGLAIVYGIIKQHRGQINVYSEPGRGTTFRIYLPLAGAEVPAAGAGQGAGPLLGGSETILVAEDDASVRELVATVLTQQGYTVILAEDGQEAVERYGESPARIDLLLMDLIMPRLSGKDAFDQIRRRWPEARVLFTSGYTADIIQSRGELDEHAELVMKPVAPRELLLKIRAFLDR
jgi:PAS domain S-box-containing protein